MEEVTLKERVDRSMVKYLYTEWTFDSFKEHHCKRNDLTGEKADDIKSEYKRLKDLLRKFIDCPDGLNVEYKHSIGKDFGRVFGKGVQGLSKKYRGALMRDLVTDIDGVNFHPNILNMVCRDEGIDCPCLQSYILNRDTILEQFSRECNISRDQAKVYFLKATNDCVTTKIHFPFFNAYDAELKRIQKSIMKLSKFGFIIPHTDEKERNKQGSFINCVMCYYEWQILQDMKQFLEDRAFEVATLMHDGLMIYGNEYTNTTLLEELGEFINEKWSYLFKFVYKSHDTSIQMPQQFTQPDIAPNYQDIRDWFNRSHFKCGQNYICIEVFTKVGVKSKKDEPLRVWNKKQITDQYCHLNADDKDGSFIIHWLANKDSTMKFYVHMDVYPNKTECPEDVFNLWQPFYIEKDISKRPTYEDKKVELDKILNHIKILCNHDEGIYEFMLDWIANMLQYPQNKSVVPIIIGEQGAGKGILIDLLRHLIGEEKFLETDKPHEDVWGKFNAIMAGKYLVHLNELEYKHCIGNDSTIKGLVTQQTINIQAKGKDQITIKSFHHYIVTTNKPNPIQTCDGDRRNVIFEASSEKKGDKRYSNEMYKLIGDDDVLRTVWDYFTMREVKDRIGEEDFPILTYQEELKEQQRDPINFWFEDYIIDRVNDGRIKINGFALWENYQEYMKARNFKLEHTNINNFAQKVCRLGKKINETYPEAFVKVKVNGRNMYYLDFTLFGQYYDITVIPKCECIDDPE